MRNIFISIVLFLITEIVSAQPKIVYTDEDVKIFNQYISYISDDNQTQEIDILLEKTALFFLQIPYVAQTLEHEAEESVVVNLRVFDCTTYIETVIALAKTVHSQVYTFDNFIDKLEDLRYRGGVADGYSSRLHYFTDWLYDNENKGILRDLTVELGGVTIDKNLNFMSTHRSSYTQLSKDENNLDEIINIEKEINERGGITFIPKENIDEIASLIPNMSIVAFSTTIGGLDVTHTGFVYNKGNHIRFIHASSAKNKVVVDTSTLSDYCNKQKSCTGVILAKIL